MPRFGEAHKLLSATHPDTEPPAAGADPADGQVPTWSDALKAWTAQDPTGDGVTVHKDLLGLDADDHPHYALADKSRPDPWVAAADLAARSLADLGTKDHGALTGRGDDDHPHYALLAGRSGGQALIGGSAASEDLQLQSTAHATRGLIKAIDALQVGVGPADGKSLAIGGSPQAKVAIHATRVPADVNGGVAGGIFQAGLAYSISPSFIVGLGGKANIQGGKTGVLTVLGLDFAAAHCGSHTADEATCIKVTPLIALSSSDAALVQGIEVGRIGAILAGADITDAIGISVKDFTELAHNYTRAYGLKVAAPSRGTSRYIAWLGGATPHLQLDAVGPGANQTALHLAEGVTPTKRRVEWKDGAAIGAGDRVVVLN